MGVFECSPLIGLMCPMCPMCLICPMKRNISPPFHAGCTLSRLMGHMRHMRHKRVQLHAPQLGKLFIARVKSLLVFFAAHLQCSTRFAARLPQVFVR
jgi:hypothetical protein